jgi:hypothetical protein
MFEPGLTSHPLCITMQVTDLFTLPCGWMYRGMLALSGFINGTSTVFVGEASVPLNASMIDPAMAGRRQLIGDPPRRGSVNGHSRRAVAGFINVPRGPQVSIAVNDPGTVPPAHGGQIAVTRSS